MKLFTPKYSTCIPCTLALVVEVPSPPKRPINSTQLQNRLEVFYKNETSSVRPAMENVLFIEKHVVDDLFPILKGLRRRQADQMLYALKPLTLLAPFF